MLCACARRPFPRPHSGEADLGNGARDGVALLAAFGRALRRNRADADELVEDMVAGGERRSAGGDRAACLPAPEASAIKQRHLGVV